MMGTIQPSKDQYLVARDSNVDLKIKKKAKNTPEQKRDKAKSQKESSGSKKNPRKKKKNKGEMSKCVYCSKGYDPESSCMKNKIDTLTQLP